MHTDDIWCMQWRDKSSESGACITLMCTPEPGGGVRTWTRALGAGTGITSPRIIGLFITSLFYNDGILGS